MISASYQGFERFDPHLYHTMSCIAQPSPKDTQLDRIHQRVATCAHLDTLSIHVTWLVAK